MTDPTATRIQQRRRALDRARRKRLGFWRSLGRSNRLFPRKLVVTREGKWIIAIALLLGAAAVNTGNNLLYLVLSLVISVISVSGILSELCLRDLTLRRHYPRHLEVGEAVRLRIEVQNTKPRAALHLEVGELIDEPDVQTRPGYLLHLQARETGQAFALLRSLRRGPVATAGLQITTAYPFGFARKSRLYADPAQFLALPPVLDVALPWQGAVQRGAQHPSVRPGQGDTFRGLRDARPGDSLRDIHWKVSARRDRLVAREWESEASRVAVVRFVHVAPGPSDDPRTLDLACATVAGLCASLLKDGLAVGLQTLQGAVPPTSDVTGQGGQLHGIREHLAHLVLADRTLPFEWPLPDPRWASLALRGEALQASLSRGDPLTWPALSGPVEVFLVTFASRADVQAGAADVQVQLDPTGALLGIRRAGLQGAA
jgi:uncharacterized protein (DUF58 family)